MSRAERVIQFIQRYCPVPDGAQVGQDCDCFDGLSQSHLVADDAPVPALERPDPVFDPGSLVRQIRQTFGSGRSEIRMCFQ